MAQGFHAAVKQVADFAGAARRRCVASVAERGGRAMCDSVYACAASTDRPASASAEHADFLTALAQQARLLEFGLDGDGEAARGIATAMESALTGAMDAESADELHSARNTIDTVLARLTGLGMRLTAQLDDIEIGGVLGSARMPVLTAVLTA